MARRFVGAALVSVAAAVVLSACGTGVDISSGHIPEPVDGAVAEEDAAVQALTGSGEACVILPSSDPTLRWEAVDRPLLEDAFAAADVSLTVGTSEGDPERWNTVASEMFANGCMVMVLIDPDVESSLMVMEDATMRGANFIDYDQLSVGLGSSYYVGYDPTAVGAAVGEGLASCLKDAGTTEGPVLLVNGPAEDRNAAMYTSGSAAELEDAGYDTSSQVDAPWSPADAARTAIEGVYGRAGSVVGIAAASDALAGSAAAVIDADGRTGDVLLAGNGATLDGLQRVLLGTQCMTVFTDPGAEARSAADLAALLRFSDTEGANALTTGFVTDPETTGEVASVLLKPISVFVDDVKDLVDEGLVAASELCATPDLQAACTERGIS